jgi:hypothetical protein
MDPDSGPSSDSTVVAQLTVNDDTTAADWTATLNAQGRSTDNGAGRDI